MSNHRDPWGRRAARPESSRDRIGYAVAAFGVLFVLTMSLAAVLGVRSIEPKGALTATGPSRPPATSAQVTAWPTPSISIGALPSASSTATTPEATSGTPSRTTAARTSARTQAAGPAPGSQSSTPSSSSSPPVDTEPAASSSSTSSSSTSSSSSEPPSTTPTSSSPPPVDDFLDDLIDDVTQTEEPTP